MSRKAICFVTTLNDCYKVVFLFRSFLVLIVGSVEITFKVPSTIPELKLFVARIFWENLFSGKTKTEIINLQTNILLDIYKSLFLLSSIQR